MNRKIFIQSLALLPLSGIAMKLNQLHKLSESFSTTETMPVLFLGHGSPMNAIEENEFVSGFRNIALEIPKPKAILCVSAHWETKGTYVTAMDMPPTIYDFSGFPKELFAVKYPAPGSTELAQQTKEMIRSAEVGLDTAWGLDHGAWSVLKHLYPKADVPVIQLSLDYRQAPDYHYQLAKELTLLRKKGILMVGSGNIVHNLGLVDWSNLNKTDYAFSWAQEASTMVKKHIQNNNHKQLIDYKKMGKAMQMAVPTPEHYLPLLYTLALKEEKEEVKLFNDKAVAGALTMTSVKIG